MEIARSTYYDAPAHGPDDTSIVEAIGAIHDEARSTAGGAFEPNSNTAASSSTPRRSSVSCAKTLCSLLYAAAARRPPTATTTSRFSSITPQT
jgi:hypothetical protein